MATNTQALLDSNAAAHDEALDEVLKHLKLKPRTARGIAALCSCSRPTAYARIIALEKLRKIKLKRTEIREGKSGPTATLFALA